MTREEAISAAAGSIKIQILLDDVFISDETSRRIYHELEKIYAIGQIHALLSNGLNRDEINKTLLKGD